MNYLRWDRGDLFWYDYYVLLSSPRENGFEMTVQPVYTCTAAERDRQKQLVDDAVAPILSQLADASDYEKVVGVYTFLVNQFAYDLDYTGLTLYENFRDNRSVCEGYARSMQYILPKLGVETLFVEGTGHGEPHSWNIVKVDGSYYLVDATWGDPLSKDGSQSLNYNYCMLTDDVFYQDHACEYRDILPACTAVDANYFVREGLMVNTYDEALLQNIIVPGPDGKLEASFRCASKEVYNTHMQQLFTNKRIWEVVDSGPAGGTVKPYAHSSNDTVYTITVHFQEVS